MGLYGYNLTVTGYNGIIHSIDGVLLVLITRISGHNCGIFQRAVHASNVQVQGSISSNRLWAQ